MTNEEKQVIIDKAIELGFEKHFRVADFLWCRKDDQFYYIFIEDMMFGEFNGGYNDKDNVKSPEHLQELLKKMQ